MNLRYELRSCRSVLLPRRVYGAMLLVAHLLVVPIAGNAQMSGQRGAELLPYSFSGTKPVCSASIRGAVWYTSSAAGVLDLAEFCCKLADDTYAWRSIDASGGSGAPTSATYLTQTADATLTAEQAMGALATGLVRNATTTGVQSIYAGTSCTNQFPRSLDAGGAATCASVADADLASNYSGIGACAANQWASTLNDNAAPTCTQPGFSNLSGTATIAQGGTGQTTATAAFNGLDPLTTKGDMIVHNGTDSVRVPVGSNGQVLSADSTQANGVAWAAAGGATWTTVKKTSDEARASNVTLTADGSLVVSLSATTFYRVNVWAFLTTTNATMDYKYDLNYTGTTTSVQCKRRHAAAGAAAGTGNESTVAQAVIIGSTSVTATTSGTAYVETDCAILTNAAGTFQFRWAQNTSDTGNLTVLRGSYLEWATF